MHNLDKVAAEMSDSADFSTGRAEDDGTGEGEGAAVKLLYGVSFMQGDIFDITTMVSS